VAIRNKETFSENRGYQDKEEKLGHGEVVKMRKKKKKKKPRAREEEWSLKIEAHQIEIEWQRVVNNFIANHQMSTRADYDFTSSAPSLAPSFNFAASPEGSSPPLFFMYSS
jgi:hypothetical protein